MRCAVSEFEATITEFRQFWFSEPQDENAILPILTVVLDYTALMTLVYAQVAPYLKDSLKLVAPLSLKTYVEYLLRETKNLI